MSVLLENLFDTSLVGSNSRINDDIELTVFNRTAQRARQWQSEFNGNIVNNLREEIQSFDCIILCVGRDEDMREIFFDKNSGIFDHIKENTIVVDHTTTSYDMTVELANK